MKTWIIAAVIVGLLIAASIGTLSLTKADIAPVKVQSSGCGACNGKCTASSNCGLSTCGASSGGSCSCGSK